MNVISRKLLKAFYESTSERKKHAAAFTTWFNLARAGRWRNFQDAKAMFGQTDTAIGVTGRTATIFDVGGNKYRIVAHVDYVRQTVQIRAVMDHEEYDKQNWLKLF